MRDLGYHNKAWGKARPAATKFWRGKYSEGADSRYKIADFATMDNCHYINLAPFPPISYIPDTFWI